jgi:hypothetical protein
MMQYLKNKKARGLTALSLVLVMLLATVGSVSAAEFPKGETIPADQTIDDDVFIGGENVAVDGTVNGLLLAAGQTVTLNGTVNGDAFLMAERVIVSESAVVDGNLFVGAADVVVNGTVTGTVFGGSASMILGGTADMGRNFFYGGFSLEAEEGSVIAKDLFSGTYQSILSGDIERDLSVGAAAVVLNGNVGRNALIEVGDVNAQDDPTQWMQFNPYMNQYVTEVIDPGIRVSDDASIGGMLTYTSSVEMTNVLEGVTGGSVVYQTPVPAANASGKGYSMDQVRPFNRDFGGMFVRASVMQTARNLLKLMAIGALILWLLRKPFIKIIEAAYAQPMKAMGWGFIIIAVGVLAMLIVPLVFLMVGVLIGFISLGSLLYVWFGIVGTALTLAAMLFFFAIFTISKIIAAYMFGKWIMKAVFKEETEKVWLNLLIGVFLYTLLRAIPFVGWLVGLAATLIGSGAFWLALPSKK